ncbi:MAG: M3 family oligoendopeptidase [Anaerolineae bacterium]|nr:M3 family oligoendopeptidase [Anaerolineae bacterium]
MSAPAHEVTGAEQILWDLSELYSGVEDPTLEQDLKQLNLDVEAFAGRFRGKIASLSASELAEALSILESIGNRYTNISGYASLTWTTDTANPAFGALLQRVREAGAALEQKKVFFDLEWAAIPDERLSILEDAALAPYRHYLEVALKYRPHLLSEPEEKILAEKGVTGRDAWVRFFGETVEAVEFDFEGKKVPQSIVLKALYHPDRELRRRAADSVTAGLRTIERPVTFIMNTLLQDKFSDDTLRKYPSWITSRNLSNEASDKSVEALITAVTSRYDIVSRFYRLKKRLLGYETLYDYDRYAPLQEKETHYSWDSAREIVLNALGAFDPQMAAVASEFFDKRWIHAPIKQGKRGGAYASPMAPNHHPYVFLNYAATARDVSTLAHELGHGIHMYLSRPRGYFGAYTPLTTAEMASVFGEMLVFKDLMHRERDPQVRLSMLASKIEGSFATIFRQISMNRFEDAIHNTRRQKGELTAEEFGQAWYETQCAMFGDSVTLRDDYRLWWAYIPHFIHTPGYVYAYAFGELLVLALFNRYQVEGKAFVPKYLEVLASGGSDKPENILARVGVDLTNPSFWEEGIKALEALVIEAENLVV